MVGWLEQYEKQFELFGGVGDVLVNSQVDFYLSQVVLDLQFGYFQCVGYDVVINVLSQLQCIGNLYKCCLEYVSFGVLCLLDILLIFVEMGFISNNGEEWLLGSDDYQEQIVEVIYNGLCNYFMQYLLQLVFCGEVVQIVSVVVLGGMLIN